LVVLTYIETPPSFLNVESLKPSTKTPNPPPDVRYAGIQNYGEYFSDVHYNEQSAAVGEIPIFTQGERHRRRDSWVFLHFSRPVDREDEKVIRKWGAKNDVKVQQLAILDPALAVEKVAPLLIYRQKEPSETFRNSPGSITGAVPCYPWMETRGGPTQDWVDSPLQNTASATQPDGETPEQNGFVPVSITCEYEPGKLDQQFLDNCLEKVLATNPSWFDSNGNTTCDPNL
jgi:hypothetical protein